MDKKILIEYADMKEEIKDLRRRIAEDKKKIEKEKPGNLVFSRKIRA